MLYTLFPLGNPGEKYAHTRHNAGRVVLSLIEKDIEALDGCEIFIPDTFMNESGRSIAEYFRYHEGRELVIVYDDKDLAYGKIRISHDRGDGGHNGVKSIIEALGTKEFVRIRVGIAHKDTDGKDIKAPHGDEVQGYVMGKIQEEEEILLRTVASQVLGAIKTIVEEGYQKAMERYN
jgi:PTH1 family peptidyl-tRNA hydrolase